MIVTNIKVKIEQTGANIREDDQSPDPHGKLARFCKLPFEEWKDQLIQTLDTTYCEDGYTLSVTGTEEQCRYLEELAKKSEACKLDTYHYTSAEPINIQRESQIKPTVQDKDSGFRGIVKQFHELASTAGKAGKRLTFGYFITKDSQNKTAALRKAFEEAGFQYQYYFAYKSPGMNIAVEEISEKQIRYYENPFIILSQREANSKLPDKIICIDSDPDRLVEKFLVYIIRFVLKDAGPESIDDSKLPSRGIEQASVTFPESLYIGEKAELIFKGIEPNDVDFENLTPANDPVVSYSSGVIEGLKSGKATVRCKRKGSIDDFVGQGTITVLEHHYVSEIAVSDFPKTMKLGEKKQLYVDVFPPDAENARELRFTSSNRDVLKVSNSGKVTAVGPGHAEIEVLISGGAEPVSKMLSVEVPQELAEIRLSKREIFGHIGQSIPLAIQIDPPQFSEKDLTIYSDDPSIATYKNGKIQIHSAGVTVIHFCSKTTSADSGVVVEGTSSLTTRSMRELPIQIGIVLCLLTFVFRVLSIGNMFYLGFLGAACCAVSLYLDPRNRRQAIIWLLINLFFAAWFMGRF